jgi:hypothetical protein
VVRVGQSLVKLPEPDSGSCPVYVCASAVSGAGGKLANGGCEFLLGDNRIARFNPILLGHSGNDGPIEMPPSAQAPADKNKCRHTQNDFPPAAH